MNVDRALPLCVLPCDREELTLSKRWTTFDVSQHRQSFKELLYRCLVRGQGTFTPSHPALLSTSLDEEQLAE